MDACNETLDRISEETESSLKETFKEDEMGDQGVHAETSHKSKMTITALKERLPEDNSEHEGTAALSESTQVTRALMSIALKGYVDTNLSLSAATISVLELHGFPVGRDTAKVDNKTSSPTGSPKP